MKLKQLHYGWVIVIIGVCVLAVHAVVSYTFGIFLTPLTMEFNWGRGALSGAVSISALVSGLLGILGGRLSDKYGPRISVTLAGLLTGIGFLLMSQVNSLWQVYLIWGIFMGVGGGFCFIPIMSTVPKWFARRRGLALAITGTGFGLGGAVSAPLARWLISAYSWQQAYIVLGLITLIIIIPLAQFMKHSPQRVGLKPYGEDEAIADKQSLASTSGGFSVTQAIKAGKFWIFGLMQFSFSFCFRAITVHIAPHAVDIGISALVAASMLSIIGGVGIAGRLSMGFISERVRARPAQTVCLGIMTLALVWLLFVGETWMLYIFAGVFGLAYGGLAPLQTLIIAELFGTESLGIIHGSLMLFTLMGSASGPPLAGTIFDVKGGYGLAFLICVVIGALAIIFSLIILRVKGWRGGD